MIRQTLLQKSFRLVTAAWCVRILAVGLVQGHEGHVPLPTKGVQIDVPKGLLTLSAVAQHSLGVQTATAEPRSLGNSALAYATLVTPWQSKYFISSQISGRIAQLHVVMGEPVEKGQLLVELSSPELEVIRRDLKNALNSISLSDRLLNQARRLVASDALRGRDLFEAESKHLQNVNLLTVARTKLRALGFSDEELKRLESSEDDNRPLLLPIVSPADGSVNHVDLAVGKVVAANEHLFEISNLPTLWVKIGVLERDVRRVEVGQAVELELSAYPGEVIRTSVAVGSVSVDPITSLGTVWAEIRNPTVAVKYLPGMYGMARITTSSTKQVLAVPNAGVLGTGAERYLLVEVAATSKGYEYKRQHVVIGSSNATHTEIVGGQLYPGDRVVSRGAQVLSSFFVLGVLRLSPEGIRNVGLRVEPAGPHAIDEIVEFDGRVDARPEDLASVSSQMPGLLHSVLVDRGQKVEAGQVVAEIAGLPIQDLQLEMVQAHIEAELLDTALQRLESIRDAHAVAARFIWETESQRDSAVNRRDGVKRTLTAMGMSAVDVDEILRTRQPVRVLPVRTPISGIVVALNKVLGEPVAEEEPLLEIQNLSRPWIEGFVSELQARQIAIGTPARVRLVADPDFVGDARVVRSARLFTGDNRTLSVWLDLGDVSGNFMRRNLLARISATVDASAPQLAVPTSAVLRDGTRAFVFVQSAKGLMERRPVELGIADDRYTAITKGLSEGEGVVVQGVAELQTTYASIR